MSSQQQQQQQQNTTLPTFVKQLLLLVLPKQSQQMDNKANNKTKATSPFEKMYFSFPALEEDTVDSTCGQDHTRHQRHEANNNVKTNNIIC
jgi:hypothetical protein